MPEEVKKIVQERLKQTSKEKDNANAKTDMYLEESGGKFASGIRKNLRILDDDDSDEDDKLLARETKD